MEFYDTDVMDAFYRAYYSSLAFKPPTTAIFNEKEKYSKNIYIEHELSADLVKIWKKTKELKENHKLAEIKTSHDGIDVLIDYKWHRIESKEQLPQLARQVIFLLNLNIH